MTTDLISDMLTRIRNASLARHSFTILRYSKQTCGILEVLKKEGYIKTYYLLEKENSKKEIKVLLKYKGWWIKKPFFSTIRRISKPGQRLFSGYKEFKKVVDVLKYNQGTAIISTSSGIMSHFKAIKLRKGGEVLCYIG